MKTYKLSKHLLTVEPTTPVKNQLLCLKANQEPFTQSDLFEVAERDNPKRAFLFVSKILSRHIPQSIENDMIKEAYSALGAGLDKVLIESGAKRVLMISFAETATQMGVNILSRSAFCDISIDVVHSTRTPKSPLCHFEEGHSHATSHYLEAENWKTDYDTLILIDDEFTTGNTAYNTLKQLKAHGLLPRTVITMSFLDWRENISVLRDIDFGYPVEETAITLYTGRVDVQPLPKNEERMIDKQNTTTLFNLFDEESDNGDIFLDRINDNPYRNLPLSVITPYSECRNWKHKKVATDYLGKPRLTKLMGEKGKVLLIAFGENHYIAEKLGRQLIANGTKEVFLTSITRSPIHSKWQGCHPNYPIHSKIEFHTKWGEVRYLYNVNFQDYDAVAFVMDDNYREFANKITGYSPRLAEFTQKFNHIFWLNDCQLGD